MVSNISIIIAPGRVNLLGEHVDYNDGPVLPVAIDKTMKLAFEPRPDDVVELSALDLGEKTAFRITDLDKKVDLDGRPLPSFALYPASVAWAIREAGFKVQGMRAAYTSNIPIGSGLSSSAAVEMGFASAFMQLGGWDIDRMDLVRLAQKGENEFVGVHSGLMDQFASLFGMANHALYLDTRDLSWEPVPLPQDVAIVVANSNVPRKLAESAYNDRQSACQKAVSLLQQTLPDIQALRDLTPTLFNRHAHLLPQPIRKRARHVVEECARVYEAVARLRKGDLVGFGALMAAGHASLRDLYEVSLPELDTLVELAMAQPGCFGARLTGAGFGGCTVNLVRQDKSADFISALASDYAAQTGRRASIYLCQAAQGVHLKSKE